MKNAMDYTTDFYGKLQKAFGYYNEHLFDGCLDNVIITTNNNGKALGYASNGHWFYGEEAVDEISLCKKSFNNRTLVEILSTLVHEMCHVWQYQHGKPSRGGYHNKEWGVKMKEVGLHPSSTAQPGGKETGQRVSHYIVKGGAFINATIEMVKSGVFGEFSYNVWSETTKQWEVEKPQESVVVLFEGFEGTDTAKELLQIFPVIPKSKKATGRTKYTCPSCNSNVWGKADLAITCTHCGVPYYTSE